MEHLRTWEPLLVEPGLVLVILVVTCVQRRGMHVHVKSLVYKITARMRLSILRTSHQKIRLSC